VWRLFLLGRAAFAATEQIDGGAQFKERVGGGLYSCDPRDGIEDDALLLGWVVGKD
jgi:hypothetical protein